MKVVLYVAYVWIFASGGSEVRFAELHYPNMAACIKAERIIEQDPQVISAGCVEQKEA